MEDVHQMKSEGVEETFLMLVDSSMRDLGSYPDPSNYAIEFNAPFRNVIGLELVDATIPRAEYTIDEDCNTLVYAVGGGAKKRAVLPPGDYNLVQMCQALVLEDGLTVQAHTDPYERSLKVQFSCPTAFALHMHESSCRMVMGFYSAQKVYASAASATSADKAYSGGYPGFATVRLDLGSVLRQQFTAPVSGRLSSVTMYGSRARVAILDGGGSVLAVADAAGALSGGDLVAGEVYTIECTSDEGADVFVNAGVDVATLDDAPLETALCCELFVGVPVHEIVSPGIVDLTGPRYILVKCPEIESLLYRDRSAEPFHAGLGMVKMGTNAYQEQRFDFVSFPRRNLTNPIGKVSKLSFQLVKPDGTLYNSRGVNNALLLVIRYLTVGPPKHDPAAQLRLNPQYTADVHTFLENKWSNEVTARDAFNSYRSSP